MKAMFNWISNLFKHQSCQCVAASQDALLCGSLEPNEPCKHDFAHWQISTCRNTTSGTILLVQVRVCRKCMYSQIDRQEV